MSFPVDEFRYFLNVFDFVSSRWMRMRPIPAASISLPTGVPDFQGFCADALKLWLRCRRAARRESRSNSRQPLQLTCHRNKKTIAITTAKRTAMANLSPRSTEYWDLAWLRLRNGHAEGRHERAEPDRADPVAGQGRQGGRRGGNRSAEPG
jgi:hypothetical protein